MVRCDLNINVPVSVTMFWLPSAMVIKMFTRVFSVNAANVEQTCMLVPKSSIKLPLGKFNVVWVEPACASEM
eukprot:Ihof_evm16s8 gene=Ihof_evmTU16s8